MDPALLSVLRAHNPWLDQPERQRELLETALPSPYLQRQKELPLRPGRAELVVGPRQTGKSTWILENLSTIEDPLLVLNAEEPRIQELGTSPGLALDTLREVLSPKSILLLEEVQHLPDASLFIKGLVDIERRRRIVATGSSSFALRARTRESLAGRARRTLLLPFSLSEVAADLPDAMVPAIRQAQMHEHWEKLVVSGGYPEPWFADEPLPILYHLVESFVLKDVSDLHRIERPAVFRKLLELAAADIGNLVNLSGWASVAQSSRTTVERYLAIAEQVHVLRLLPPFVGGKRAEVTGTPKVYFLDNGLRNAVFGGFEPTSNRSDRGALWENAVYQELLKKLTLLDEVRFWRSKNGAEVDFVVTRQDRMVAVEVKAKALRQPQLSRAARSFLQAYHPSCFGVVNSSLTMATTEYGVPVLFCRPWELDQVLAAL
jgi:predicted AAA+ superfamily ATPase